MRSTRKDGALCVSCLKEPQRQGRGLGIACYSKHARAIRKGETTWAKLEAAGLSAPVTKKGAIPPPCPFRERRP